MPEGEKGCELAKDVRAEICTYGGYGKVWFHIWTGCIDMTPDVTRETANELRNLAADIDAAFRFIDRSEAEKSGAA